MNFTAKPLIDLCTGMVSFDECKTECLKQAIEFNYEFVWLFVMGFIFTEMAGMLMYFKNMNSDKRLALMRGFKVAGYCLNLAGCLYFLIFVI